MLSINSDTTVVPHSEFFAYMSALRRIFVDKEEMLCQIAQDKAVLDGVENLMLEYMKFYGGSGFDKFTTTNLRNFLINVENVNDKYFLVYNKRNKAFTPSMNETVLNRLLTYKVSPYLLDLYSYYQSLKTKVDNLTANTGALIKTDFKDNDGNELYAIPFYYTMESTGRIYSKSVNVQGWTSRYDHLLNSLDDYFLLWGDFAQIDLRVALQLCLMGDPVMKHNIEEHQDRYEAFARTMYQSQNIEFDVEKFKVDRNQHFKAGILAPIYGMSEQNVINKVGDASIGSSIFNYINQNESYKEYKKNLIRNKDAELDFYATTYFGTKMSIGIGKENNYTAGLNKPIQGTSGDIMKIVTVEICKRMNEKLHDRNLFVPLVNKHDETIFLVSKKAIKYLYEFIDCTEIQVDDWPLLNIEWSAGYRYKQKDEELIRQIKSEADKHPKTPRVIHKREKVYTATPRIMELSLAKYQYQGYTFITLLDFGQYRMRSLVLKSYSLSMDDLLKYTVKEFDVDIANYDRIIYHSTYTDYKTYGDELEVIITETSKNSNKIYYSSCVNMGIAVRFIENELHQTCSDSLKASADISLRKGFDFVCQNLT